MSDSSLAIYGGAPAVRDKLPHWPWFDEPAIRAVEETLRSGKVNYWTGRRGMEFEKRFAEWQGSRFAISTTGTSALHVAITAQASAPATRSSCRLPSSPQASLCRRAPSALWAELGDHCLSVASARLVTERTKAACVHLYGNVADMDPIRALATQINRHRG
jgi:dTDP-4-amino-4,6-dideoxygalactose transaminase